MAEQAKTDLQPSIPDKIRFHYIKSNYFRVVHVDGAYGGITARGTIEINLYSERPPIPQVAVHQVKPDGTLGDEIKEERVGRDGIIREIEVGATMDLEVAKSLMMWLKDKIQTIEDARKQAGEE